MSELPGPQLTRGTRKGLSRAAVVVTWVVVSGPITARVMGEEWAGFPGISTRCVPSVLRMLSVAYTLADSEHTSYSWYPRVTLGSRVVELFISSMPNRTAWKRW